MGQTSGIRPSNVSPIYLLSIYMHVVLCLCLFGKKINLYLGIKVLPPKKGPLDIYCWSGNTHSERTPEAILSKSVSTTPQLYSNITTV